MESKDSIKIFDSRSVRSVWDSEQEKWYISIVDVVEVLTDSPNPRNYWKVLKHRLRKDGNESVTNCNQLKMQSSDGKFYMTDVADVEQLFRLIQSIPSPKAEPFKQWLAQIARERRGVQKGQEYATLTDIITQGWSGMTTKEYKRFKGLKTESLRDNMTNLELALNTLAEATTAELSKEHKPATSQGNRSIASQGGRIVGHARKEIEANLGKSIVSPVNAKKIQPLNT
jgi:hypothetical protein